MPSVLFWQMDVEREAKKLAAERPWSKNGLRRELRERGCEPADITAVIAALEQAGISWARECLRSARQLCRERPSVSRRELRRLLSEAGFLPAELEFAEKTQPVNWFDHARAAYEQSARLGVDPSAAQHALQEGGFSPAEIAYALGEVPDSEEERALHAAQYLLASAPSSEAYIRGELGQDFDQWAVQTVIERLGSIWNEQAMAAGWHLVGRYGVLLSQQRLGSYLYMQGFTLTQVAHVLRDLPVDWDAQALGCARYYHYRKGVDLGRLRESVRQHRFTSNQAKAAVRALAHERAEKAVPDGN